MPCVRPLEPLREAAVPPAGRSAAGGGFDRHSAGRTGGGGGDHASVWRASEPGEKASSISCIMSACTRPGAPYKDSRMRKPPTGASHAHGESVQAQQAFTVLGGDRRGRSPTRDSDRASDLRAAPPSSSPGLAAWLLQVAYTWVCGRLHGIHIVTTLPVGVTRKVSMHMTPAASLPNDHQILSRCTAARCARSRLGLLCCRRQ